MSDSYNEDKKWIISSIESIQTHIEKLFANDTEIKITLATINTKLMMISTLSSAIVGIAVAIVMKFLGVN